MSVIKHVALKNCRIIHHYLIANSYHILSLCQKQCDLDPKFLDKVVLRIHGFASTWRNCMASTAAFRPEKVVPGHVRLTLDISSR